MRPSLVCLLLLAVAALGGCGGDEPARPSPATSPDSGPDGDLDGGATLPDALPPHADGTPPATSDAAPGDGAGDDAAQPDDAVAPGDGQADLAVDVGHAPPEPGPEFSAYCRGRDWQQTRTPAIAGELSGRYAGHLEGVAPDQPFFEGVLETMKIVPPYPFQVERIRVAFSGGEGPARLRLTTTFGRSYPPLYWTSELGNDAVDLIEPVEIDVQRPDPESPVEIDVAAAGVFLLPTQHYMIVYEHLAAGPYLALESVARGDSSRALLFVPPWTDAYGLSDGQRSFNYRLELDGQSFCSRPAAERWFAEAPDMPFAEDASEKVAVVDLDGDGHEDLVVTPRRVIDRASGYSEAAPVAYLGDGQGGFTVPPAEAFPSLWATSALVFGDVDGDGDPDAFAGRWVSTDGDLDGYEIEGDPADCDDADPAIQPEAEEVDDDGLDNDCDRIVDDGASEEDRDDDGVSVAGGDCDDTRPLVLPGAAERRDGLDNDCDGRVDEDFPNQILLNDGLGRFTPLEGAGVEALDPTTVAGFADVDADGDLDLYWGNWLMKYPEDFAVQDRFVLGLGDGRFAEATEAAGMILPRAYSPYGLMWTDFNNDAWPDLFVGNYHMYPNQLWKNEQDGTFVDVAEAAGVAFDDHAPPRYLIRQGLTGGHTYGADYGDVDNDGDMDCYIPNLAHPRVQPFSDRSMFVLNDGPPAFFFHDETEERGFVYDEGDVMAAFGDFDNDGDLDLAVASLYQGHYARLYRNDGEAGFTDVTYEAGIAVEDAVTVLWADVDEDGLLDLLVADRKPTAPHVHLFVNRFAESEGGVAGHWLELDLEGDGGNRDALGARITLRAGGVTHIRDVRGGAGLGCTQHPHLVHFGLGEATEVEVATVRWVGGEAAEAIRGLAVDGRYRIVQGTGQAIPVQ